MAGTTASRASRRTPGARPRSGRGALERHTHVVVLAGGAGERFWPSSRRRAPKPFLEVVDGQSLLAATLARARLLATPARTWIVCGHEHAAAIRRHAGLPRGHVLVEPLRRNTAMAAAWAASRIEGIDPEAVIVTLPADHRVPDAEACARALRRAVRAAADAGALVTLGIRPTRPEPGYGYIELGPPAGRGHRGLHQVRRFVEKPTAARARGFLRRGGMLWNAGIFVWGAGTLLDEMEVLAPELREALGLLRGAGPRGASRTRVARAYAAAPSLPVDVAVMERSRRVWTLPVSFRWSDVGSWASLAGELPLDRDGNAVVGGAALLEESRRNLVWGASGRLVALFGVEGLAVVDTGDALLVAPLDRSGDLRRVVAALREGGRDDLT